MKIYLMDLPSRKQTLVLEGPRNGGNFLAYSHAGDLLASTGWDGTLRLWDPRTGKQLFSTPRWAGSLQFSADDRLLAANINGNMVGLWEVAPGREYRTLVRDPALGKGNYYTSAIHQDGRLLAVGMGDGTDLWDLTTG